ncbi:hypothetical protein ACHQM5_005950 [Ranunculus cassubicifolius]
MASALSYLFNFVLFFEPFYPITNNEISSWYSETKLPENNQKNITNFHFYFHDVFSGSHPTAKQIIGPDGSVAMVVVDNALTEGPDPTSKLIGRAQGGYGKVDGDLIVAFTCAFLEGKYNGSTLNFFGKSPFLEPVTKLSIIGGSGVFVSTDHGYATVNTVWLDTELKDSVVEYNVTVSQL